MMVAAHCWWLGLCCLWLADEALCAPPPAHTHLKNGGNGSSIVVRFGPGAAYYETFLRLVMPVVLRPLTLATHRDVVLVDETEAAAEGHCSVGGGIESPDFVVRSFNAGEENPCGGLSHNTSDIFISPEPWDTTHVVSSVLIDTKLSSTILPPPGATGFLYLPFYSLSFSQRLLHTPRDLLRRPAAIESSAETKAAENSEGRGQKTRGGGGGQRRRDRFCAFIASNCLADRMRMVELLRRHGPVDALGACGRNNNSSAADRTSSSSSSSSSSEGSSRTVRGSGEEEIENIEEKEEEDPFGYDTVRGATYLDRAVMTYERYRFVLCFENSRVSGYVTEKIVNAFLAGAVPVYLGAPDVAAHFDPRSFVDCHHFKSLEACAAEVARLDASPAEYERMRRHAPLRGNRLGGAFSWHPDGIASPKEEEAAAAEGGGAEGIGHEMINGTFALPPLYAPSTVASLENQPVILALQEMLSRSRPWMRLLREGCTAPPESPPPESPPESPSAAAGRQHSTLSRVGSAAATHAPETEGTRSGYVGGGGGGGGGEGDVAGAAEGDAVNAHGGAVVGKFYYLGGDARRLLQQRLSYGLATSSPHALSPLQPAAKWKMTTAAAAAATRRTGFSLAEFAPPDPSFFWRPQASNLHEPFDQARAACPSAAALVFPSSSSPSSTAAPLSSPPALPTTTVGGELARAIFSVRCQITSPQRLRGFVACEAVAAESNRFVSAHRDVDRSGDASWGSDIRAGTVRGELVLDVGAYRRCGHGATAGLAGAAPPEGNTTTVRIEGSALEDSGGRSGGGGGSGGGGAAAAAVVEHYERQIRLSLLCDGYQEERGSDPALSLPLPWSFAGVKVSGTDAMWIAEEIHRQKEPVYWEAVFKPLVPQVTAVLLRSAEEEAHTQQAAAAAFSDNDGLGGGGGCVEADGGDLDTHHTSAGEGESAASSSALVCGGAAVGRVVAALACVEHALRTGGHTAQAAHLTAARLLRVLGNSERAAQFEERARNLVL